MFISLKRYLKLTKMKILVAILLTIIYFLVDILDIVVVSSIFNVVFAMPSLKVIISILAGIIHFIIYFMAILIIFKSFSHVVKSVGNNKKIAVLLAIILWLWESKIAGFPKILAVIFPILAFDHGFVPNAILFTSLFIVNYLMICLLQGLIIDIKDR
ncbi:MAG: hypothetical protein U9P90_04420 [Patescibacteria group bacterium]|nr:hypothetical protein [Patescibacteria group bacterium]